MDGESFQAQRRALSIPIYYDLGALRANGITPKLVSSFFAQESRA